MAINGRGAHFDGRREKDGHMKSEVVQLKKTLRKLLIRLFILMAV